MSVVPANYSIRPAALSDLDALLTLEHSSFNGDRLSRRSLRHLIKGKQSVCLIAEAGSVMGGYILLLFRRGSSLARIYSLAVNPECRGQGVGRQLLVAGEQTAVERHCLFVRLEVRVDNEGAFKLYRSQGYRQFATEPDYYEDGASALRLEKSLLERSRLVTPNSPFYAQTTPFTCGPASLIMAMSALAPGLFAMTTHAELQLWREATTIYMTAGHGGCSPEGLALSAWRRGFAVTLYLQCDGVPFLDSVRGESKKRVVELVHEDFIQQIEQTDIELINTAITPAQLQAHVSEGAALVALISTWRLNRNKEPHWVFVAHSDEHFVYLNDPDIDEESSHPLQDNIGLPIRREEFERMACFGSRRLKATLVIKRREEGDVA